MNIKDHENPEQPQEISHYLLIALLLDKVPVILINKINRVYRH